MTNPPNQGSTLLTQAYDLLKSTTYGAFAGATVTAVAQYATPAVNYLANVTSVSVLTKALPYTDAMGSFVAPLGAGWTGVGVGAALVGGAVLARNVIHGALTSGAALITTRLSDNLQKNWYAQRAGSFVVYTIASLAAVAATAYIANAAFGLALTKTAIAFAASGPAVLFVGETLKVLRDTKEFFVKKVDLFFAERTLKNAAAAVTAKETELNGTRQAQIDALIAERDNTEEGKKATDERKQKIAEELAALKISKDVKVIGLDGEFTRLTNEKNDAEQAIANEAVNGSELFELFSHKGDDATAKSAYDVAVAAKNKIVADNTLALAELQKKITAIKAELNTADTGLVAKKTAAELARDIALTAFKATYVETK